jgi:Tol biopolymer transport system component
MRDGMIFKAEVETDEMKNIGNVSWSADGSTIAFTADTPSGRNIFVMKNVPTYLLRYR